MSNFLKFHLGAFAFFVLLMIISIAGLIGHHDISFVQMSGEVFIFVLLFVFSFCGLLRQFVIFSDLFLNEKTK